MMRRLQRSAASSAGNITSSPSLQIPVRQIQVFGQISLWISDRRAETECLKLIQHTMHV